jgi:heat-inducible transcriptional repressor
VKLTTRDTAVLREIVLHYVRTGRPVSSGHVARTPAVSLSPASVRNVMAELEEMELLQRPHPSAGARPTDLGLRVVLERSSMKKLPPGVRQRLERRIVERRRELVEDLGWVAEVAAELTGEAGVVARPLDDERILQAISLVRLGESRVLGIVITDEGVVEKSVLDLGEDLPQERLQEISNYLNYRFSGFSVRQILEDVQSTSPPAGDGTGAGFNDLAARVARSLLERGRGCEVVIAGTRYLLDADEFADGRRLGFAVAALEDRERLLKVLKEALLDGCTGVVIGRESELTEPGELGIVVSVFRHDGRRVGAVGVVGPRRMDYFTIVPTVEYLGQVLTRMLDGGAERAKEFVGAR